MPLVLKKMVAPPRAADYFKEYSRYVTHLLTNLDYQVLEEIAKLFIATARAGQTIYFAGNGGSAAAASHFATDFSHGLVGEIGELVKAVSLTDNVALLTAIGNDRGYDKIFVNQLANLLQPKDVVVLISASGNSPNVVEAAKYARSRGAVTVSLIGFDGGALKDISDYVVHVEAEKGEYGPVEDIHAILNHMMASYLILTFKKYVKEV